MSFKYELTQHRVALIQELADGNNNALFQLYRFTRLAIPDGAKDAIFQDYKSREIRGEDIHREIVHVYENGIVQAAATILRRVKGDTYTRPLFAWKPIY